MEKEKFRDTIEKLLVVQERDQRIMRYQKELDDIPVMKSELESKESSCLKACENAKISLVHAKTEVNKLEVEIDAERQHVLKLRDQQLQIKSNEEYKALNNEIANLQKKIKDMEDREFELMENIERAEDNVKETQASLEAEKKRVGQEIDVLDARRKSLEADVEQLQNERQSLAKEIDDAWMKRYDVVMQNKRDIALAVVEGSGACSACHMNLQPQIVHNVKAESAMISCGFCGRLLYWAG